MVTSVQNRLYQAYYTKSEPILRYMVRQLRLRPGQRVLEPCAGDGDFIDVILREAPEVVVDAFELNPDAVAFLVAKYRGKSNVRVECADSLESDSLFFTSPIVGRYDAIVANPPYGAWIERNRRHDLKKQFRGAYAKETYGLFLHRCLNLLRPEGRLSFIIPDTWLHLHRHQMLREELLNQYHVESISLFPSDFFPGVNFGYAGLSILTLQRNPATVSSLELNVEILTGFQDPEELLEMPPHVHRCTIKQAKILSNPQAAFLNGVAGSKASDVIASAGITLKDVATCVTGFYSGCDREHLRCADSRIRGAKKYTAVDPASIWDKERNPPLDGCRGDRHFIPIVKGGSTRFHKPDSWYMDWSCEAVETYRRDKRARFQNASYYFREGLAVPMVSSTVVTACLLKNRLFDQSIVGVFPHDEQLLMFLLAFFNSSLATTLVRAINPSANNSANYLKKVPIVLPTINERIEIDSAVSALILEAETRAKVSPDNVAALDRMVAAVFIRGGIRL